MTAKWADMTKTEKLDALRKELKALAAKVGGQRRAVARKTGARTGQQKRSKRK
jgi:hypothetical protein